MNSQVPQCQRNVRETRKGIGLNTVRIARLTECFRSPFVAFAGLRYTFGMNDVNRSTSPAPEATPEPPEVEVVIEIPRGSFLKRGSTGQVDFISPLPCPYNYGSVPKFLGLEGDLLDALVLGPAAAARHSHTGQGVGSGDADRSRHDGRQTDLQRPPSQPCLSAKMCCGFFVSMRSGKGLLNIWRNRPGRNASEGWCEATQALARARPRNDSWKGSPVEF